MQKNPNPLTVAERNGEAFDSNLQPNPRRENCPSFQDLRWNSPPGENLPGLNYLHFVSIFVMLIDSDFCSLIDYVFETA